MHMMPGGKGPMRNVTELKANNNWDSIGPVWTFSGRQYCDGEQLTGEQIVGDLLQPLYQTAESPSPCHFTLLILYWLSKGGE